MKLDSTSIQAINSALPDMLPTLESSSSTMNHIQQLSISAAEKYFNAQLQECKTALQPFTKKQQPLQHAWEEAEGEFEENLSRLSASWAHKKDKPLPLPEDASNIEIGKHNKALKAYEAWHKKHDKVDDTFVESDINALTKKQELDALHIEEVIAPQDLVEITRTIYFLAKDIKHVHEAILSSKTIEELQQKIGKERSFAKDVTQTVWQEHQERRAKQTEILYQEKKAKKIKTKKPQQSPQQQQQNVKSSEDYEFEIALKRIQRKRIRAKLIGLRSAKDIKMKSLLSEAKDLTARQNEDITFRRLLFRALSNFPQSLPGIINEMTEKNSTPMPIELQKRRHRFINLFREMAKFCNENNRDMWDELHDEMLDHLDETRVKPEYIGEQFAQVLLRMRSGDMLMKLIKKMVQDRVLNTENVLAIHNLQITISGQEDATQSPTDTELKEKAVNATKLLVNACAEEPELKKEFYNATMNEVQRILTKHNTELFFELSTNNFQ